MVLKNTENLFNHKGSCVFGYTSDMTVIHYEGEMNAQTINI